MVYKEKDHCWNAAPGITCIIINSVATNIIVNDTKNKNGKSALYFGFGIFLFANFTIKLIKYRNATATIYSTP